MLFCYNCGKQLPDGTKFCNYCGAQQSKQSQSVPEEKTAENPQQTVPQTNTNVGNAKNKKSNILIILAVALVAFLVGKFLIAPSMLSGDSGNSGDSDKNNSLSTLDIYVNTSPSNDNPSFDQMFLKRGIVSVAPFYFDQEVVSFAKEDGNDIVRYDFGYKGDIIYTYEENAYFDITEMSEDELNAFDEYFQNIAKSHSGNNSVEITCKKGSVSFYSVHVTIKNLNDPEVLKYAVSNKLITLTGEATALSMKETEKSLLSSGYIKK